MLAKPLRSDQCQLGEKKPQETWLPHISSECHTSLRRKRSVTRIQTHERFKLGTHIYYDTNTQSEVYANAVLPVCKHINSERLFIRTQTHNLQIFDVIPFVRLQNDTSATVKWLKTVKNEIRREITYPFWLSYVVFLSSSSYLYALVWQLHSDTPSTGHGADRQSLGTREGGRYKWKEKGSNLFCLGPNSTRHELHGCRVETDEARYVHRLVDNHCLTATSATQQRVQLLQRM